MLESSVAQCQPVAVGLAHYEEQRDKPGGTIPVNQADFDSHFPLGRAEEVDIPREFVGRKGDVPSCLTLEAVLMAWKDDRDGRLDLFLCGRSIEVPMMIK